MCGLKQVSKCSDTAFTALETRDFRLALWFKTDPRS